MVTTSTASLVLCVGIVKQLARASDVIPGNHSLGEELEGVPHAWPATVALRADQIRKLLSKSAIARRLDIGRTSVRRILKERIR